MRRSTVAVGAVLAAAVGYLALVAVPKVRDAASRSRCQSRHKQLAFGLVNLESVSGRLPAGTFPVTGVGPDGRLSWFVALLPYIEENTTFKRFDQSTPADDPRNVAAADARIALLNCYSSGGGQRFDNESWKTSPPVTHTVAVSGVGPDAAALPPSHPRAGLIGDDRGARLDAKDVPDGLANTLLLAEIGSNPGHWARGGWNTLRHLDPAERPHLGPGRAFGGFHVTERNWFSANGYSVIVAMADGSVRTLSDRADPAVLEALATAAGGDAAPGE